MMQRLLLTLFLAAALATAQPNTTIVTDTIHTSTGALAQGSITCTPNQQFETSHGVQVYPIGIRIPVVNGLFSVHLYPNDQTIDPVSGTSYSCRYALINDVAPIITETWVVTGTTPLDLQQVRANPTPVPLGFIGLDLLSTIGATTGECIVMGVMFWQPQACPGGGGTSYTLVVTSQTSVTVTEATHLAGVTPISTFYDSSGNQVTAGIVNAGCPSACTGNMTYTFSPAFTGLIVITGGGGGGSSGLVSVSSGGTGVTTLAAHGVLLGEGTSPVHVTAAGGLGTILVGMGASADPTFSATPTLGVAGTTLGTLTLSGNTAGAVTLRPAATTAIWTLTVPTTAGSNGFVLQTDGSGNTSWVDPGALSCTTCVFAVSPGLGLAHFSGLSQTVTSSLVVNADIAASTISTSKLANLQGTDSNILTAGTWSGSAGALVCTDTNGGVTSVGCGGGGGGGAVWSNLSNATAALTLANTTFGTTFNQTSAVNWLWANITNATSGGGTNSPIMGLRGAYWTGGSTAADTWSWQNVVSGTGTNNPSNLTFTHVGTGGPADILYSGGGPYNQTVCAPAIDGRIGTLTSWYSTPCSIVGSVGAPGNKFYTGNYGVAGTGIVPSSSTDGQSGGVLGTTTCLSTTTACVALTGYAAAGANGTGLWGANVYCADGDGPYGSHHFTGVNCQGIEVDLTANTAPGGGSTSLLGLQIFGESTSSTDSVGNGGSTGIGFNPIGGACGSGSAHNCGLQYGINFSDGSVVGDAIVINSVGPCPNSGSCINSDSASILFSAKNAAGLVLSSMKLSQTGQFQIAPAVFSGSFANVSVGTSVPFQVGPQTFAGLTALVTSCSSGNEGTMAPVVDSTTASHGATISGSGSNHVVAYCNGSNWVVLYP